MLAINIQIQQTETGYLALSPEIPDHTIQGESLDTVINEIKEMIREYLNQPEQKTSSRSDKPIWEIAQEITSDMSEEEIRQLPSDGAEQHNHYIYGIPKHTS
jgi:predicted RNase H-like HicB family nuclease